MPLSSLYRNSNIAESKRYGMINVGDSMNWSSIPKRKGYTQITEDVKEALMDWIVNHDNVRHSSSKKDVIKVKMDGHVEKVPMQKLFMQISFKELYADLLKPPHKGEFSMARDSNEKTIINQSMLQKLMPLYVKPTLIQRKLLCGCEICVSTDTLQSSLNHWKLKIL